MKVLAALVLLPLLWPVVQSPLPDPPAADPEPVEITEWKVPWERTRPRDPYVDAQGRVWFVGQVGNYAAYLEPATGEFKRFDLGPRSGPHNLIVDPEGYVWYAGNRDAHIGKLDPRTGQITRYEMPNPDARDPHTLIFDRAGDIWFTVQGGNFVGKLTRSTGKVQLVEVPTPQAHPYGIAIDPRGRVWVFPDGNRTASRPLRSPVNLVRKVLPAGADLYPPHPAGLEIRSREAFP